jgi:hypothetical protein
MHPLDRRTFLRSTLGSAGATSLWFTTASADDKPKSALDPDTLFLTWQRDPTTTMTVQWVGKDDEPNERVVSFAPDGAEIWQTVTPLKRRYPRSEKPVSILL